MGGWKWWSRWWWSRYRVARWMVWWWLWKSYSCRCSIRPFIIPWYRGPQLYFRIKFTELPSFQIRRTRRHLSKDWNPEHDKPKLNRLLELRKLQHVPFLKQHRPALLIWVFHSWVVVSRECSSFSLGRESHPPGLRPIFQDPWHPSRVQRPVRGHAEPRKDDRDEPSRQSANLGGGAVRAFHPLQHGFHGAAIRIYLLLTLRLHNGNGWI